MLHGFAPPLIIDWSALCAPPPPSDRAALEDALASAARAWSARLASHRAAAAPASPAPVPRTTLEAPYGFLLDIGGAGDGGGGTAATGGGDVSVSARSLQMQYTGSSLLMQTHHRLRLYCTIPLPPPPSSRARSTPRQSPRRHILPKPPLFCARRGARAAEPRLLGVSTATVTATCCTPAPWCAHGRLCAAALHAVLRAPPNEIAAAAASPLPQPLDAKRVAAARRQQSEESSAAAGGGGGTELRWRGRFCADAASSVSGRGGGDVLTPAHPAAAAMRAGVLSDALREALGLAPGAPSPLEVRAARFGVPPAYGSAPPPCSMHGLRCSRAYAGNGELSTIVAHFDGECPLAAGGGGGDGGGGGSGGSGALFHQPGTDRLLLMPLFLPAAAPSPVAPLPEAAPA